MAQRIQVQVIDDLTGGQAQERVQFGLDGIGYEIDLSTENAEQLRSALAGYIGRSRRAPSARGSQEMQMAPTSRSTSRVQRDENQRIRQWARDNGYTASARGRIDRSIVAAYRADQM